MPGKNLEFADAFANEYDQSIVGNNWNSPQLLFELLNPLLCQKSNLLDLGIGTGESSVLFYRAGHRITGVDGSVNMLKQCKKKDITEKLIHYDLEKTPLPLNDENFDAIISNGVFHLIHPLRPIFSEVARILMPEGYFIFTYENTKNSINYSEVEKGIWENKTTSGVLTYKHSQYYIKKLLVSNHFNLIESKQFLAFRNTEQKKDYFFTAVLAQLKPNRPH
jgi:predicted TPR repeat methyltransferase